MQRDKSGRAILSLTRRARDLQLTWQQLLAGHLSADKAPRWPEQIAGVLSRGDQDPISKPKPYIKQYFPKTHELRFANEWQPIHCDLGVMTTAINQLREREEAKKGCAIRHTRLRKKTWLWEKDGAISPGLCFLNDYFR